MANSSNFIDLSKLYNIPVSNQNNNSSNLKVQFQEQVEKLMANEGVNQDSSSMRENDILKSNTLAQNIPITTDQRVLEQFLPAQMNKNDVDMSSANMSQNMEIVNFQGEYNMQNLNDLMRTQVGKNATIQFLIGNENLVEKRGTILSVGDDYILLNEDETGNLLICDFYNIRFITLNY